MQVNRIKIQRVLVCTHFSPLLPAEGETVVGLFLLYRDEMEPVWRGRLASSLWLLESSVGEAGDFRVRLMKSSSMGLGGSLFFFERLLSPVGVRGVDGRMALREDVGVLGVVLTGCSSSE